MIRCSCHVLRDKDFKEAVDANTDRLEDENSFLKDSGAVFRDAKRIGNCGNEKSCTNPCISVAAEFIQSAGYYKGEKFPDRNRKSRITGAAPLLAAE